MSDRSNPFSDIEQFFQQMNRSFGDVALPTVSHDVAVDIAETETEIVVTADLPGFEKEDVTISLAGRDLTIEADDEEESTVEEGQYHRRERIRRQRSRTVRLPDAVDETAATADYRNGVLTVTLPREVVEDDEDSHTIDIS